MKISELGALARDWAHQCHEVVSTRGVRGVLSADGAPLVVRQAEIDTLRASEHRGFVPAPKDFDVLVGGQRVFVQRGVLVDNHATYNFSSGRFDYVTIAGLFSGVVKLPKGALVPA
jgi:hypothetical protein